MKTAPFVLAAALLAWGAAAEAQTITVDPDAAANGQDISAFFAAQGVALSTSASDSRVFAADSNFAPTGDRLFAWFDGTNSRQFWAGFGAPAFRADFSGFTADEVSISVSTDGTFTLTAFDAGGNPLASESGAFGNLTVTQAGGNIAYVTVTGVDGSDAGFLDNLVITPFRGFAVPEPGSVAFVGGMVTLGGLALRRRARK